MLICYRLIIGFLFYLSLPFLLLFVLISGRHREGLGERFALYPRLRRRQGDGQKRFWLHASSVGEVRALKIVVDELLRRQPEVSLVVTTMTIHGRNMARRQLPETVSCLLAPLDVPFVVKRAIQKISPDAYFCLETELWPLVIDALHSEGIPVYLLNGRISERSYHSYLRMKFLLGKTMRQFTSMALISEKDRERFLSLGADPASTAVFGNLKYDLSLPESRDRVCRELLDRISPQRRRIFIAGSTHTGEEELLLDLYARLLQPQGIVCVLVPRHIERVDDIEAMISARRFDSTRMSCCQNKEKEHSLIVVDTMGELSSLYGISDFIFIGGSFVNRGGHNMMEAVAWGKAVFYGPFARDFQDAAVLLEEAGAGFMVSDIGDLEAKIRFFLQNPKEYERACAAGAAVAGSLQGAGKRQVDWALGEATLSF